MNLRWGVILVLGALGLVRPLLSITGVYENTPEIIAGGVLDPVVVTIAISLLWVGTVVFLRLPNPFLSLVFVGAAYGVFAILLQQSLWLVLPGGLPPEVPQGVLLVVSWGAIIVTNVIWGALLGLIAAGLMRLVTRRPGGVR